MDFSNRNKLIVREAKINFKKAIESKFKINSIRVVFFFSSRYSILLYCICIIFYSIVNANLKNVKMIILHNIFHDVFFEIHSRV